MYKQWPLTSHFDWLGEVKFEACTIYVTLNLDKHSRRMKGKFPKLYFLVFGGLLIIQENDVEPGSANVAELFNDSRRFKDLFFMWAKSPRLMVVINS